MSIPILAKNRGGAFAAGPAGGTVEYSNAHSLAFDGVDDVLTVENDASALDDAADLSISAWVKWAGSAAWKFIFTKCLTTNYTTRQYSLYMRNDSPAKLTFGSTGSGSWASFNSSSGIASGSWAHIAVTCDSGVTNGTKIYINGSLDATGTITIAEQTSSGYVLIGAREGGSMYMNGNMDEVAIWRSVLSSSDVTDIYNSGVAADISSLSPTAWWRMGDTQGPTTDSSSPSPVTNAGSISNTAAISGALYKEDVPE